MMIAWDERGLAPAVAQDADTGQILMVAWMNQESLDKTLATKAAWFWSRSRKRLWHKGETSGHTLAVREIRVDCDADTLLLRVTPAGPACHTGKPSCFYRDLDEHEDDGPPLPILARLERVIAARRASSAEKSYTKSLLEAGMPKILAKLAEEHEELAAELPSGPREAVVHETADLLFHLLVGLAARDIPLSEIWGELDRRFGVGGHAEKASRS
jgi:phosphoribosyl-AMP cyclohydrolase / phosphoribosyl-ATP pyrophosphohydrolase